MQHKTNKHVKKIEKKSAFYFENFFFYVKIIIGMQSKYI